MRLFGNNFRKFTNTVWLPIDFLCDLPHNFNTKLLENILVLVEIHIEIISLNPNTILADFNIIFPQKHPIEFIQKSHKVEPIYTPYRIPNKILIDILQTPSGPLWKSEQNPCEHIFRIHLQTPQNPSSMPPRIPMEIQQQPK